MCFLITPIKRILFAFLEVICYNKVNEGNEQQHTLQRVLKCFSVRKSALLHEQYLMQTLLMFPLKWCVGCDHPHPMPTTFFIYMDIYKSNSVQDDSSDTEFSFYSAIVSESMVPPVASRKTAGVRIISEPSRPPLIKISSYCCAEASRKQG